MNLEILTLIVNRTVPFMGDPELYKMGRASRALAGLISLLPAYKCGQVLSTSCFCDLPAMLYSV